MPLLYLQSWQPFKIDALGIVTLLGAGQLDRVLGQLTENRYFDSLPLLGAYIFPTNQIVESIPGFSLYNITDGILATDLAGWFARWLLCQDLRFSSTTILISPQNERRRRWQATMNSILSIVVGIIGMGTLVSFAATIKDWWGFANALSMIISTLTRRIVLHENRLAIDRAFDATQDRSCRDGLVQVFLTLPNGHAVTVLTTRTVVIDILLTTPRPPHPRLYDAARVVGWAGFGAHVITLGMSSLFCQILTVFLLLVPTVLVNWQVGTDCTRVGSRLRLQRVDAPGKDFRAAAYARLNLSPKEEESMVQWSLFPHRSNTTWWEMYRQCQQEGEEMRFEHWDRILAGHHGKSE